MNDGQLPLQTAIYTALTTNSYISSNSIGVYDMVPKGTPTPFLTIGNMTVVDDSSVGVDKQVITLNVHTWDQGASTLRLKTMMNAVVQILHNQQLTLTSGFLNVNTRFVSSQTMNDPDGVTVHGVQKFRCVVENV